MFRGLTQQLHELNGGKSLAPHLDPAIVAASFGAAYPPNQPLPESDLPENHVEDDVASGLRLDERKLPDRPAPRSLLSIVRARLSSITPKTKQRQQEVAQALLDIVEPLTALDNLVGDLEQEHFSAIEERWNSLQERGRKVRATLEPLLEKVHEALRFVNETETEKEQIKLLLQRHHREARKISVDRFASEKEIAKADALVVKDREAMQSATGKALNRQRQLADAQNALALAKAELEGIVVAMDQCSAELAGKSYHDPQTGLSVDPRQYQAGW